MNAEQKPASNYPIEAVRARLAGIVFDPTRGDKEISQIIAAGDTMSTQPPETFVTLDDLLGE